MLPMLTGLTQVIKPPDVLAIPVTTTVDGLTVVVAVALLLPGVGSAVVLDTAAVALMLPLKAALTFTTTVITTDADGARSATTEQFTVPDAPTAGVVQVVPIGAVTDTNVVLAPNGRLMATAAALLGPALVVVMVYVTLPPATTGSGASAIAIPTLACAVSVSVSVAELFPGVGSVIPAGVATVAVFANTPVADALTVAVSV